MTSIDTPRRDGVWLENGHHARIDTATWIGQRVGAEHHDLTMALRDWGTYEHLAYPRMQWIERAELWCAAREYPIADGFPILLDDPRLSEHASVLLATAGQLGAIAVVSIDDEPPTVYADITTDEGCWYHVDGLDIICPGGHSWTWYSDREVLTADMQPTSIAALWPDQRHAPFSDCPDCTAYDTGVTDEPCPTPGVDVIVCPQGGQRCTLHLTEVPTYPQPRRYAVHLSQHADYRGWVLAVDADDADDVARDLLDAGAGDDRRGHLELVRLDRQVMANDATQLCWRCRTDPRQPNPACAHPRPEPAPARAAGSGA
jgi:uncharacterized protein YbaR (Trm112 family)